MTFGVSGRLYKRNVLLYDHQTESLWSQLMEKAVSGPLVGKGLKRIDSIRTSWKSWKREHPETLVLSTNTGFKRDYSKDPYAGFSWILGIWFPVGEVRRDLPPKEMVLGVEVSGKAKAYPVSKLRKRAGTIKDSLGGEVLFIEVTPDGEMKPKDSRGEKIPAIYSYWFAWQAFHPGTDVYGK